MPFASAAETRHVPSQLSSVRRLAPSWPLRRYLITIALALLFPLLTFTAAIVWHDLTAQHAALRRDLLNITQAVSLAVDRQWGTARAILDTLAASTSLDSEDFQAFYDLCARAIAHRPGTWIVLFDPSGQQVINTLHPFGTVLPNVFSDSRARPEQAGEMPLASPETVRRAFETGTPVYSDLFVGLASQRPTVSITVPVLRQDRAVYSLTMGLSPEVFSRLIQEDAPDDPVAMLVDRRGMIIARSQEPESFVGRQASPDLRADLARGSEGWDRARTGDQVPVYHTWTRSSLTGWSTIIAVPEATVTGPTTRLLAFGIGGSITFLGLGLGLSLLAARRVTIPLAALARSAHQVQRGQPIAIPQTAVQEVQDLYAALAMAADAVRRHAEEYEQRLTAEAEAAERRRAAEAIRRLNRELQQRLDEFQTLFDVMPVGIGVATDAECQHIRINPYFAALLKLPPGVNASLTAALKERPTTFRIERDGHTLSPAELPMQDATARGVEVRDMEVEIVHTEGQRFKILCHVVPLFDQADQVRGCIGVFLDITARQQAEDTRRQLAAIVESSEDAIISETLDGLITSWNRGAERLYGYSMAEALGQPIARLAPPDLPNDTAQVLQRLEQGEHINHYETRRLRKDGTLLDVSLTISPMRDASGRIVGASKIVRDITERKRTEEALRQSEERFRVAQDLSPDGFTILRSVRDEHGSIVDFILEYVNPATATLLRRPVEALQGRRLLEVVPGHKTHPEIFAAYVHSVETGESLEREFYYDADGIRGWFRNLTVKLGDGVANAFSDITARKQTEETMREETRRKDEFLALLAHELRNPLAPIRNAVELLHQIPDPAPHLRQAREVIDRQVGHMVRLIDDLLDVARITRSALLLRKAPVALSTVIEHALETSRPLIEARQHQLTVTLPRQPVYLDADLTRLAQAVGNLLHNAAKYTDEKGQIWLTAMQEEDEVVIRVRDTGRGITAAFLPRAFEAFTRADHTLSRTDGGLGIGLALVRHFVEAHGGGVTIHSAGPGQGCEAMIYLPALAQSPPAPAVTPPEDGKTEATPGYRILVVDDYVDAAKSLAVLLRRKGHEVQVAHDGPTALVLAPTFQPRVVVLDIGLPGMDGYEVAKRLRQAPGLHETVLIALTGYGQYEDRQRARQAGFHHHLIKPVKIKALYALLEEHRAHRLTPTRHGSAEDAACA